MPDHFDRRTTTTAGKVAGRPQCLAPPFLLNAGIVSFFCIRRPLKPFRQLNRYETVAEDGYSTRRWIGPAGHPLSPHFALKSTHTCVDALKVFHYGFCESAASVFGHNDPMHMHLENAVSTLSDFMIIAHRPEDSHAAGIWREKNASANLGLHVLNAISNRRRYGGGSQFSKGGTHPVSLCRYFTCAWGVGPRTHRSDSGSMSRLNAL